MEPNYFIKFPVNSETVSLVYISQICGIDSDLLLLLYEKYGTDLFYFFYLFTKTKVEFPTPSKLSSIRRSSADLVTSLKNNEPSPSFRTKQEETIYEYLKSIYHSESGTFVKPVKIIGDSDE